MSKYKGSCSQFPARLCCSGVNISLFFANTIQSVAITKGISFCGLILVLTQNNPIVLRGQPILSLKTNGDW